MTFLSMRQVEFSFPGWPQVVQDVDLQISQGEFYCLVGRSGCGKTTLLKLAAGLLRPNHGSVTLEGVPPAAVPARLGFVFQVPTLLDWQRVMQNLLLPVSLHRRPTLQDRDRAQQLLTQLGLGAHANRYPRQLSGGQQSRVALARALILQPSLLLLDEPFASLDAITREELQDDLLQLCRKTRTTVLFVTHDIAEAVYLGDRIGVMDGGRVVNEIKVDLTGPRQVGTRYSAPFGRRCAAVRQAMDAAREPA